jgi:PPK2 family polyphosphate:nucleotide phosphotransferase
MAQAKQGKQDKKSAKADKVKKAKETETVQVKAAVKAEKTAAGSGAEGGAKTVAAKADKAVKTETTAASAPKGRAKAVAEKAEKTARVAKAAAAQAPQDETETAGRDEAQRAKEEFKAAKAAAKAVLKAEDRELEPAAAKKLVEQVAAEIIAADAASAAAVLPTSPLTEQFRLKPGAPVDLAAIDTRATPGVQTRAQAEAEIAVLSARVGELQERLYAAAAGGGSKRRVLLVLQGMDTSGKGGTVRHVAGLLDPNGTRIKAFKAPTAEELEHDFLWRIRENAPAAGQVGIFDRSQYEDVLVAKVRKLALPMHIGRRYGSINRFEKSLADDGCVVVKCFLHISPAEQRERLLARLENPDKHWKYSTGDVDDRLLWPEFQEAYRIALERCGTEDAPWHVVPADRKWYRNYAVLRLLIEALESIDPQYPAGEFDLEQERARVLAS